MVGRSIAERFGFELDRGGRKKVGVRWRMEWGLAGSGRRAGFNLGWIRSGAGMPCPVPARRPITAEGGRLQRTRSEDDVRVRV